MSGREKVVIRDHSKSLAILLFIALLLASCDIIAPPPSAPTPTLAPTPALPEAMVTFSVMLPAPPNPGEAVYINILDEVTGLALNPKPYVLQAENSALYSISLPFPLGSVVKYRYTRVGANAYQEHLSDGRAVRYRILPIDGPAMVQDVISRWTDTSFNGATGRISGQIVDAANGAPLPNILVAAGGAQTLTTSDGSYLLEGLPPGTHLVVAYSLDGLYQTFKQGATVEADKTTPAPLRLTAANLVNVNFVVTTPSDTPPGAMLRFAGNLAQLGNTFADLTGGVNTVATRMPVMALLPDGRYSITLTLPAGADLRYKYTLGDGLWSAEHTADGAFRIRQLIVPANGLSIEERVDTWKSGSASAPITFEAFVPANTPAGETISIQFNPGFGWTASIPMWPQGGNRWKFTLTSPLDRIGAFGYRYCREDQCGSADDAATMGSTTLGYPAHTSGLPQDLVDDVLAWAWLGQPKPATVPNVTVTNRGASFVAGIEFQPFYNPTWGTRWPRALNGVVSLNANWLFLSPTWTYTRQNYSVLEPLTGSDALWPEQANLVAQARSLGLQTALFPQVHFPTPAGDWWQTATRDFPWWNVWFERYRTFAIHHADLAARTGSAALILGGEDVWPALPGANAGDGSSYGVPADAAERWRVILRDVRAHYSGLVLFALPYPQGVKNPPPFLDAVDGVYILWSAPLSTLPNATDADLQNEAGRLLDVDIQPFQTAIQKPILLGLSYPAADGALSGCVPAPSGGCLDFAALARPNDDVASATLDLDEQTLAYNAIFFAVNTRPWIAGVVARGYYPPVVLVDKSTSVNGKPASGVLWYWYPRMLGKQ